MVDRVRTSRSKVVTGSPAVVGWAIVGGWAGGFCSHGSRQDRRVGVSAPVGVHTAAYHASRCALASPPGGWVRLSSRWRSLVGCFAAPATLAALRLLVPPGADDSAKLRSLAAAGFPSVCGLGCARWRLPLASGRIRCRLRHNAANPHAAGREGLDIHAL